MLLQQRHLRSIERRQLPGWLLEVPVLNVRAHAPH
jgi:hypothetical protein